MAHEADVCSAIAGRREAGVRFDGSELALRIDELGEMTLSKAGRHEAFAELYEAFTPTGFRLLPFPDDSAIEIVEHRVRVHAVIADDTHRQVVAEIDRDLILDRAVVSHELLRIQAAYRGGGLSLVLLSQALPLYRRLGLRVVLVHAALETGRWQWARLGFDFAATEERALVMGWATLALAALGAPPIPIDAPARRLAQLGTGEPPELVSLERVRAGVEAEVAAWERDPAHKPTIDALKSKWNQRALDESGGRFGILDRRRLEAIAAGNALGIDDPIPMGKAIMLAGPDWLGAFDLTDQPAQDAFDREFSRRFSPK